MTTQKTNANPKKTEEKAAAKPVIYSSIRKLCFSAKELEEIELISNFGMVDFTYTVKDEEKNVVLEGCYHAPQPDTLRIAIKNVLPLKTLAELPFDKGNYFVSMDILLANGKTKKGGTAFAGTLTQGTTATEVPEKDRKTLREKVMSIPIAKPGMTTEELRKICLDYMNIQCEFAHKISEDINYVVRSQQLPRLLSSKVVHGGLPYVTVGSGNLYRILEAYDDKTGTLDASMDCIKNARLFGNACSGGTGTSWSRVVNSAKFAYTATMTQKNGFLPVGPYKYSKDVSVFVKDKENPENEYTCKTICQENGEQVMFESYAAMIPADGVGNHGHVRMNTAYPTVIRNEDGTIDGEKSFTLMSEQVCFATNPNHVRILPDGTHYTAQGFVDHKYTFKELLDTNYIPFTFAEFIGQKEVDEAYVLLSPKTERLTLEQLKDLTVTANFAISDVFVCAKDKNGTELYRFVHRSPDFYIKEIKLGTLLPLDTLKEVSFDMLEISCQLYNGQLLTAYKGPVVKE